MNLFQSLVLAMFGLFAIAAVVIFSFSTSGGGDISFAGTFKLWGTLPAESMLIPLENFNSANSRFFKVEYTEKRKETFQNDLISALAAGTGPDLVIMPENLIVQNSDKIIPIGYDLYPVRNFSDNFMDGATIFMSRDGIFGMPLYVDPLMMYWNKDIFSTGGVASYPTKWSDFENLATRLTISGRGGNITQSAVALGTYLNIDHAKDILSALFMQAGNELVRFSKEGERDERGDLKRYTVLLGDIRDEGTGVDSALRFYLDFSNPAKKAYSWNVAMPNSRSAFAGGVLAVYFGHASDYSSIQRINPHLNFDVAILPQRDSDSRRRVTFGNIYAVSVTRGSKFPDTAKQIAAGMAGPVFAKELSDSISLPPARRDLLAQGTSDPIGTVAYTSAIMTKSWLDPMPSETNQVFQEMTESVLSGVRTETQAIMSAGQRLSNLVRGR